MDKSQYLIIFMIAIFIFRLIISIFFSKNEFLIKIKNFFLLVPVMVHEVLHLIGSFVTGGKPLKLIIKSDLSGLATFRGGQFSNFFAILIGYPGTSLFALATTYTYLNYDTSITLYIFIACSLIATLYMRSLFTFLFMVVLDTVLYFVVIQNDLYIITLLVAYFVASCIMEALYSAFVILQLTLINFKREVSTGDAGFLKEITKLPAILWGLFFFIFSLIIFVETIRLL